MTLRVIDTETCGLDGGVVEVASLDLLDGQLTNPMSDLVSPDRPISLDAMAIHHITEQMVEGKPRIAVAIGRYQGSPYYVAHNAAFDRGVLPEMNGARICTLKLARTLYPDIKYGNQYLRYALNPTCSYRQTPRCTRTAHCMTATSPPRCCNASSRIRAGRRSKWCRSPNNRCC